MSLETTYSPGLRGIVAAETRKSSVDGLAGELIIAGYALEEIAPKATFEEIAYLLWYDELPTQIQLTAFAQRLAQFRTLPAITIELLKACAAKKLPVMDVLRIAAGTVNLSTDNADDHAFAITSALPTINAAYWRLLNGQDIIAPDASLSHAENYLYMLSGERPDSATVRALETYLNTVTDHGLNASTFTGRVIVSTDSDLISAVVGAIGALKGARHGGAPGPALDMVFEIGKAENAEAFIRAKLEAGELLMGFGHRVYKVRDPRADVLGAEAERFFTSGEGKSLYQLAMSVEQTALELLEEYKPGRNLQTNVEFYTALLLHGLGLPVDLFSPTFAVGRVLGWVAHAFEQIEEGSIIRPQSVYVGEKGLQWVAIEER